MAQIGAVPGAGARGRADRGVFPRGMPLHHGLEALDGHGRVVCDARRRGAGDQASRPALARCGPAVAGARARRDPAGHRVHVPSRLELRGSHAARRDQRHVRVPLRAAAGASPRLPALLRPGLPVPSPRYGARWLSHVGGGGVGCPQSAWPTEQPLPGAQRSGPLQTTQCWGGGAQWRQNAGGGGGSGGRHPCAAHARCHPHALHRPLLLQGPRPAGHQRRAQGLRAALGARRPYRQVALRGEGDEPARQRLCQPPQSHHNPSQPWVAAVPVWEARAAAVCGGEPRALGERSARAT
mmetsp:Transcript_53715/g.125564  ORF Transcript_53715/g.125564 Transcript_53715/m.125564 type:complete len:296 (+) Transcript_53715:462-1349(+)